MVRIERLRFHQFAETLDLKPQRDKGLRLEVQGLLPIFEPEGGGTEKLHKWL